MRGWIDAVLIGDFSANLTTVWRKHFQITSKLALFCALNVPNFFKTPLAAKPTSTEELGKR